MINMENTSPGHVLPKSTVIATYIGLLVLAFLMVAISRVPTNRIAIDWIDVHAVKTMVVMLTALVMGSIIALFLMGLRYDHKLLNMTIFLSNFVFLLIFVLFTWADTSFRGEVDPSFNQKVNFESPVEKAEKAEQAAEKAGKTEAAGTPAVTHATH
jgi:caa(3)-type oxidase subunit IV